MPNGPNTFPLQVSDKFKTNNPNDSSSSPYVTINYKAMVTVTWDFHRLKATNGVKFTGGTWLDAGAGPLNVYEDFLGGRKKTATVSWKVISGFTHTMEKNANGKKFRNVYSPFLKLVRTVKPVDGGTPQSVEVHSQAIANDKGRLQDIPE